MHFTLVRFDSKFRAKWKIQILSKLFCCTLQETGSVQKRPVWFVFAGMGSQWPGMGADLMKLPIFAKSIKEIDTFLAPLGVDIYDVITNFDPSVISNVVNSFVGIAAVQVSNQFY